jgi:hypothetical protein
MKHKYTMTTLFLATALALSCGKDKIIPDVYPDYSIVDGDTVKTRIEKDYKKIKELDILSPRYSIIGDTVVMYKQVKLHTPPAKAPDLSNIKNNDNPELKGKPLRYIAVGGSLTAGVRDGGYFNEGIQTSYPNLVARQMGLQKFEQPLFDAADYNGFGRKVPTSVNYTGGPVPKFKEVKNNSGVEHLSDTDFRLKKYLKRADNYSVMNLMTGNSMLNSIEVSNKYTTYNEHLKRFISNPKLSLSDQLLNESFDLISFETDFEELWFWHILKIPSSAGTKIYPNGINDLTYHNVYSAGLAIPLHGKMTFLKKLHESKNAQYGYFLNLPTLTDLPYFNIISKDEVNKVIETVNKNMIFKENVKILPTSEIDSLLGTKVHISMKKGLSYDKPLSKYSYLTEEELRLITGNTDEFNKETESLSKSFNFPVIDINSLYKQIIKGTYITDDGVKVDGSYPTGNFFSSDAIYPTAFGQAVIANEVIKALNRHYKMNIPLINTREYLAK